MVGKLDLTAETRAVVKDKMSVVLLVVEKAEAMVGWMAVRVAVMMAV